MFTRSVQVVYVYSLLDYVASLYCHFSYIHDV